jgi:predicted DNA-binding transcriptional regulator AlpA
MSEQIKQPDAEAGQLKSLATHPRPTSADYTAKEYGSKRDVALMIGMSPRTVSNFMEDGCPYLEIGRRRTRFNLAEVRIWLKEHYGRRRLGPAGGERATQAQQ